ncbi:hypothetical protein ACUNWD_04640 [Sunxiuqinia sp. A32]|uniref:hypothetical protein n=1 Tax=Sunxiuqinia sp. A32 TaxID=3461496 RepID=UPI0040461A42
MNKNHTIYKRSANDGEKNYYTKIDNRLIKDLDMSVEAKMIMIWMLSQDDSFIVYKNVVKRELGIGVKRFRNAWSELVKRSFIKDMGQSNSEGRFGNKKFIINEYPADKETDTKPTVSSDVDNESTSLSYKDLSTDSTLLNNGLVNDGIMQREKEVSKESTGEKETSNYNQSNQEQSNQQQFNQDQERFTNGFDLNQKPLGATSCTLLPILPKEDMYIIKQSIVDFSVDQFGLGYYEWERSIEYESPASLESFQSKDMITQAWILQTYKWIRYINEEFFEYDTKSWKINVQDIDSLIEASYNDFYGYEKWGGAIELISRIAHKALKSGKEYVSVSYLTKTFINANISQFEMN